MMMVFLVESQATVAARMVTGLIEIDEHTRMAQRSVAAVAGDHTLRAQDWRCILNQIDRELLVDLFLSVQESRQSIVIFLEHLLASV